jgi:hypothetical protein
MPIHKDILSSIGTNRGIFFSLIFVFAKFCVAYIVGDICDTHIIGDTFCIAYIVGDIFCVAYIAGDIFCVAYIVGDICVNHICSWRYFSYCLYIVGDIFCVAYIVGDICVDAGQLGPGTGNAPRHHANQGPFPILKQSFFNSVQKFFVV